MAEATQIDFSLMEVTEELIRRQGLHEGRWVIGLEFGLGVGNVGQTPAEVKPAALIQVNKITLVKAPEGTPADYALAVDAAVVNPMPAKPTPKSSTSKPDPSKAVVSTSKVKRPPRGK